MAVQRASLIMDRTSSAVTAALAEAGAGEANDGEVDVVLLSTRVGGVDSAKIDSSSS